MWCEDGKDQWRYRILGGIQSGVTTPVHVTKNETWQWFFIDESQIWFPSIWRGINPWCDLTRTVNFPLSSSERRGSSWGWSLTIPSLNRVSCRRQRERCFKYLTHFLLVYIDVNKQPIWKFVTCNLEICSDQFLGLCLVIGQASYITIYFAFNFFKYIFIFYCYTLFAEVYQKLCLGHSLFMLLMLKLSIKHFIYCSEKIQNRQINRIQNKSLHPK